MSTGGCPLPASASLLKNGKLQMVRRDEEAAFGNALRGRALPIVRELPEADAPSNGIPKAAADTRDLSAGLMREFQPEMPNSSLSPCIHMRARFLSLRAKNSVAAPDVGQQRMRPAIHIAQRDGMFFARSTAVFKTGPTRQKAAKNAMLRVKDWQVLVDNCLNRFAAQLFS